MEWPTITRVGPLPVVTQILREATEREPGNATAWVRLAESLLMTGCPRAAVPILREALERHPHQRQLTLLLADALVESDHPAAALQLVDRYLLVSPGDADARVLRFELLLAADSLEMARDAATKLEPTHPVLLGLALELARRNGEWPALLRQCDVRLALAPADSNARYHRALALAVLGQRREAAAMVPHQRFTSISDLPAPQGFGGDAAFRTALKEEILRNPTLGPDPKGKATRDGLQTLRLQQPGDHAVESLLAKIVAEVDGYATRLERGPDPFTETPQRARLQAWAVVCRERGRQVAHIHPAGWLSGVYYVTGVDAFQKTNAGTLLLGALPDELEMDPPWSVNSIAPKPGRLVLFPSWVPHATAPTGPKEMRISVAFDVIPMA